MILGNGPSLADLPVSFWKKYPSFGVNRITFALPEFCPTYYSCIGGNQLDTPAKRETLGPLLDHPDLEAAFLNRLFACWFRHEKVHTILSGRYYGLEDVRGFSLDPLVCVGVYATQTYISLQLAYYMGFTTALLIGLDGTYAGKWHAYDEDAFPGFKSGPGIYGTDENWRAACETVYSLSRRVYEADGRRILNLSTQTVIESFEQMDWRDWA